MKYGKMIVAETSRGGYEALYKKFLAQKVAEVLGGALEADG